MTKEIEIPEGYEARVEGNKVIIAQKESEDERIRKSLIDLISWSKINVIAPIEVSDADKALAWLEKQKEQKPAEWALPKDFEEAVYKVANFISPFDSQEELRRVSHCFAEQLLSLAKKELNKPVEWSDEDDDMLKRIIERGYSALPGLTVTQVDWLKALPERFALKPKQEWSEEDEWKRNELLKYLEEKGDYRSTWYSWLKSLRPQPSGNLAISFMNYLDEHRPDGKMCLSNEECANIETAFKREDWTMIIRYVNKYQPHWKPSENKDVYEIAYERYPINNRLVREVTKDINEDTRDGFIDGYNYCNSTHWKPSKKQMEALEDAFRKDGGNEYRKVINSLYCDLQKLL